MVFTTHIFVFYFLPLVLLVYFNLPYRWRNLWITLASYAFYGWWQPWFVCLMMFTTVMDYFWGKVIMRPGAPRAQQRTAVAACVVTNLTLLGFFKYYVFTAQSLNQILAVAGAGPFRVLRVVLPIGISFYTFHSLTYIIDLYRRHAVPAKSFTDYSAFVALFPDLVAGPIIRYKTLAEQLAFREHTLQRFASGVCLFILGFAKKVPLANPCGHVADAVFNASHPCALDAWVGVLAYAFQIYFDFCGYSDMAVGLGRMLGFEFLKNFDAPYRAEGITDLWRRWHISLSSVLRDYLYFPLGGNRKGPARTYVNLGVVMLLGGLWHGAKWNFVVWGAYHGLLLACERWRGKQSLYQALPLSLRIALTFLLTLFSWVLFRAENLAAAGLYFAAMSGLAPTTSTSALLAADIYGPLYLLVMALCAVLVWQRVQAHEWSLPSQSWTRCALLLPLFVFALSVMFSQAFNPFLYFQFLGMPNSARKSELFLITGFLAVIAGVPVVQTCIELARHERVQAADVFRYRPTATNLRQFERTLEEKSWFQQQLRPDMQWLLFQTLDDTGAKGMLGREHWLFYRPDVRYLVEPDRPDTSTGDSKWIPLSESGTQRQNVQRAILRFRDQLNERGVALVVFPIPGKPSVYPDQLTRRAIGKEQQLESPTQELIEALRHNEVPTVDLFTPFKLARSAVRESEKDALLHLARDTHWTPQGAQLAAEVVVTRLRELGLAPPTTREFRIQPAPVTRWGDLLEMMQIPRLRKAFAPETVQCERVLDPALGPLLPTPSDRPGTYRYPGQRAPVLVLGDSFCRIYQYPEPQSLGEMPAADAAGPNEESGPRRLLPGSAGFISHLARALKVPVDAIVSDGGASTDVRRKLSTNPAILEGKKVVVWAFVERDIALGTKGWEDVPLPPRLD